jgi:DNA-binding Xre family transcriptional regulator
MVDFEKAVRELRHRYNINSDVELALKSGISRNALSFLKSGKSKWQTINKLCQSVDCQASTFISWGEANQ